MHTTKQIKATPTEPFKLDKTYGIVYLDPPWDYKGQTQHTTPNGAANGTGGAETHYETVTTKKMKGWNFLDICDDDCLVFMWSSSPHLDQAVELGKAWGLSWATVAFVWDKGKVNPGFYTMSQCELCLVFKRGKIPRPRGSRNQRQMVSSPRREHSRKPDEVRERIELMFPEQRKIELFARETVPGWDAWGLETTKFDTI